MSGIHHPFGRQFFSNNVKAPDNSEPLAQELAPEVDCVNKKIENNSWLKGHGKLLKNEPPVDFKLLSLVNGDSFINGMPFEGYSLDKSLGFFTSFLKNLPPEMKSGKTAKFIDEMESCKEIADEMLQLDEGSLREYAEKLQKRFCEQKVAWMPGGWSSDTGSNHAILYKIEWDKGITIFNSGGGVENHPTVKVTKDSGGACVEEFRTQQFLSISGVDKSSFHSVDFFHSLLELNRRSMWDPNFSPDANHLYKGVLGYLNGKAEPAENPKKHPELYKKNQRSGTCAVKCVTTACKYFLRNEENYKTLKFLWQFYALSKFCQTGLNENLCKEQLELLEDFMANLTRSTKKAPLKNWLEKNSKYLTELNATCLDIQRQIDVLKNASLQEQKEPLIFSAEGEKKKLSLPNVDGAKRQLFDEAPVDHSVSTFYVDSALKVADRLATGYHSDGVLSSLNSALGLLNFFIYDKGFLQGYLANLPDDVWEKVPEEDVLPCMENLSLIMQRSVGYAFEISPTTTVLLYALLMGMDKLARRCPDSKLDGYKVDYSTLLEAAKDPRFVLEDPKMQALFQRVMHYFDPSFDFDTLACAETPSCGSHLFALPIDKYGHMDLLYTQSEIDKNVNLHYFKQFASPSSHLPLMDEVGQIMTTRDNELPRSVQLLKKSVLFPLSKLRQSGRTSWGMVVTSQANPRKISILGGYIRATVALPSVVSGSIAPYLNKNQNAIKPNKELADLAACRAIPSDEFRELLMLGAGNPYDEALQTLGFIRNHWMLFKSPDVQELVDVHLFRPLRLSEQLKVRPKLAENIVDFVKEGLNHFFGLGEMEMCLHLANLAGKLKKHVKGDFPDLRAFVLDKVVPELQDDRRGLCDAYATVALLEEDPFDIFHYIYIYNTNERASQSSDLHTKVWKLRETATPKFLRALDNCEYRNRTCQAILKLAFPKAEAKDFVMGNVDNPFYFTDGTFGVNLIEGEVVKWGSTQISRLPFNLLENGTFRALCPGDVGEVKRLNQNAYHLPDHGIKAASLHSSEFAKEIDGEWYFLVRANDDLKMVVPSLFFEKNVFCWQHPTSHRILGMKGNKVLFEIEGKMESNLFTASRIIREGKEWISSTHLSKSLHFLNSIESEPSQIECWGKGNKIEKIALNRFGLSFLVRGEKAYCAEHPGFFLSRQQNISSLPHLVLENSSGEKKVLLRRTPISATFAQNGERKLSQSSPGMKNDWLEFGYVKGALTAQKLEGKLFLLHLHLVKGEYAPARDLLKKCYGLDRYSPKEKEMLGYIFANLKRDRHPHAHMLLLSLIVKIRENHLKYPLPIGKEEPALVDFKEVCGSLQTLFENSTNATLCLLNEKEEKTVFDTFRTWILEELEKEKNLQAQKGLREFLSLYDQYTGDRHHYLKTGRAKLGVKDFTGPKLGCLPEGVSKYDLGNLFKGSFLSLDEAKRKTDFDGAVFGRKFSENFFSYYCIAKQGSQEDKERLKKLIDFNKGSLEGVEVSYCLRLLDCVRRPKKYPSLESIEKAYDEKKEIEKDWHKRPKGYRLLVKKRKAYYSKMNKLGFSSFRALMMKVSFVAKMFFKILMNKMKEAFSSLFAKKFVKKTEGVSKPLPLNFGERGEGIKRRDKESEEYFDQLVSAYFDKVKEENKTQKNLLIPTPVNAQEVVKKKIEKENQELQDVLQSQKPEVVFKAKGNLKELKTVLEEKSAEKQAHLKAFKTLLICQANRVPVADEKKIAEVQGQRRALSWEDIRELFLKGDFVKFQEKTSLNREQAETLFVGIADYMVQTTRLTQMKQTAALISSWEKEPKDVLLQSVAKMLLCVRHYDLEKEGTTFLPFELANGYLYREQQLAKIAELVSIGERFPELLAEMPTGWGKTKTAVPTLDAVMAKTKKLLLNIWPASLEMTNAHDVQNQMEDSFAKAVDRLTFNRQTGFNSTSLEFLWKEIQKNQEEGKPINARPETIRALELHFILTLYTLKNRSEMETEKHEIPELTSQVEILANILRLFRTEAWAAVDEAHINFDPFDKLIYTLGESQTVPDAQVKIVEQLFQILTTLNLNIETNNQQLLSHEDYQEKIAPKIAEAFVKKLKIEKQFQDSFTQYVLGDDFKEIPKWVENHPKKSSIALVKGLVAHVLKSSFRGGVDETFGLSKQHITSKEYAIPYASSNTPKETEQSPSQFKNPHETLVKTYITYLYKGLGADQVKKLIKYLQEELDKAVSEGKKLEETFAYKAYCSFFEGTPKPLKNLKEKEIEALVPQLSKNHKAIYYYIRKLVVPQVKIYSKHLTSTAQNFRSQFAKSLSFTATPPDPATHGPKTKLVEMKGTSGQVSHLLLTKGLKWDVIQSLLPEEVLNEANQRNFADNVKATVDSGALFRGLSNREVIESMKARVLDQKIDNVKGFVFFDEKSERFKVLYTNDSEPKDLEECELSPEERHTYYDQSRTFGSDIKQAPDAVARMLLGKETTKAQAGQGMGRMRQIHQNQGLVWMVQGPIADEIKKLYSSDTLQNDQAVGYMVANQAVAEAKNNYEGLRQQMENEVRRPLLDKLLGLDIRDPNKKGSFDASNTLKLFSKFEDQLLGRESIDPYRLYAHISHDQDPRDSLCEYQALCMKRLSQINGLAKKEKAHILKNLKSYQEKWSDGKLSLPQSVKSPAVDTDMECDVLEEVEVQEQVEMRVQSHIQDGLVNRVVWAWPEKMDLFNSTWEKTTRLAICLLFKRIQLGLKKAWKSLKGRVMSILLAPTFTAKNSKAYRIFRVTTYVLMVLATLPVYIPFVLIYSIKQQRNQKEKPVFFVDKKCPIFKTDEVLKLHLPGSYRNAAKFFTKDLLVSNNYYHERLGKNETDVQIPFTPEQKPLFHVLVMEDEGGRMKMMLIDQNDSAYFHRKLRQDALSNEQLGKRKKKVALYDLNNGIIVQGRNQFKDLEGNKAFQELLVQAKLLNGEILYNKEELAWIEKRIGEKKVNGMGQFMQNFALRHHTLHRNIFYQTDLAKLLKHTRPHFEEKKKKEKKVKPHLRKHPLDGKLQGDLRHRTAAPFQGFAKV